MYVTGTLRVVHSLGHTLCFFSSVGSPAEIRRTRRQFCQSCLPRSFELYYLGISLAKGCFHDVSIEVESS